MKTKEFDNIGQKEAAEKMVLISAIMQYITKEGKIEDALNEFEKAYVKENKVKGFAERINYFGDKVNIAAKLFGAKKIYDEKRSEDILSIVKYIEEQLENIKKEVIK